MFFTLDESTISIVGNVDAYGDSYARDTTVDELKYVNFRLLTKPDCGIRAITNKSYLDLQPDARAIRAIG